MSLGKDRGYPKTYIVTKLKAATRKLSECRQFWGPEIATVEGEAVRGIPAPEEVAMSISTFGSLQGPFRGRARGKPLRLLLCAVSLLACTRRVSAQGPQNAEDQVVVDRQTLQKMMERID